MTPNEAAHLSGSIVFADYMVHSHEYCLTRGGAVVLLAGGAAHTVSPSLKEFLKGYADDDPQVFR